MSVTDPSNIVVRDVRAADVTPLHAINQAAVPGVGSVTRQHFTRLVFDLADAVFVATGDDEPLGFALCMIEGVEHSSLNYQWVMQHYTMFSYVDRVAVSERARGHGVGGLLYKHVSAHYTGRRPVLMAEVNLEPPNPGSVRFHKREGFLEVGERWEEDRSKGVVYMEKSLVDMMAE